MVVNTVGHLAEAAFHHPDLAQKIEQVLMWQPGKKAGSALEGTPDDVRFKYLKYD